MIRTVNYKKGEKLFGNSTGLHRRFLYDFVKYDIPKSLKKITKSILKSDIKKLQKELKKLKDASKLGY